MKRTEVPATIGIEQFAKAMQQFDARGIPPEKLPQARYEHFLRVMFDSMSPYHAEKVMREAVGEARRRLERKPIIITTGR